MFCSARKLVNPPSPSLLSVKLFPLKYFLVESKQYVYYIAIYSGKTILMNSYALLPCFLAFGLIYVLLS